jgi:GT2 family glycosyltransferase
MDEQFFLYFEDLDWAARGCPPFRQAYAPGSVVYHKVGASIGSGASATQRSFMSDYYTLRNRILFVRKHFPRLLPFTYLSLLLDAARRMQTRQWRRVGLILGLVCGRHLYPRAHPVTEPFRRVGGREEPDHGRSAD